MRAGVISEFDAPQAGRHTVLHEACAVPWACRVASRVMSVGGSPHGCSGMDAALADERVPFVYLPKVREWALAVSGSQALQAVSHCPWCGTTLPESLRDEWFDRLDELGLEPASPDMPLHLRGDAWWRLSPRAGE
jgi:hypothetical protein